MKNNKKMFLILIVIILLLLLGYFSINCFGKLGLVPTGNVDIFNIECSDKDCPVDDSISISDDGSASDDNSDNSNGSTNNAGSSRTTNSSGVLSSGNSTGDSDFSVSDDKMVWNSVNKLRIFSNPAYEFKNIIAPGSSNAYQFVINNNQSAVIYYSLKFLETNDYDINMKYRIRRNGDYILGSADRWVSISDKEFGDFKLGAKKHDTYTLEWKWMDGANDTEAGFSEALYSLKIKIVAHA